MSRQPFPDAAIKPVRSARLLAVGLLLTTLWAAGASYVVVFHDDVLAAFVARQGVMQAAYEARLAEMQALVDQGRADRLGTQDSLAMRLSAAVERQAELERRQSAILGLSGTSPAPSEPIVPALADPPVTGSLPDPFRGLGLRRSDAGAPRPGRRSARETEQRLATLESRLDGIGAAQALSLDRISERAGRDVRRLRRLIGRTGLDPARFGAAASAGTGGPLVPVAAEPFAPEPFASALALAQRMVGDGDRLRRAAWRLPLQRPLRGETAVSSGFGTRLDPFTRGLALHTGLDLKAEYGEAARATAPGRVTAADSAGGYGNMVEIDHGNGVATRFAHLARIAVQPGQAVQAGDVVGLVGSTGRSTGAHLHYETRIDGEPVDPQRFLDAGREFEAVAP